MLSEKKSQKTRIVLSRFQRQTAQHLNLRTSRLQAVFFQFELKVKLISQTFIFRSPTFYLLLAPFTLNVFPSSFPHLLLSL